MPDHYEPPPYVPLAGEIIRVLQLIGLRPSDASPNDHEMAARFLIRAGGRADWAAYLMRTELGLPPKR